MFPPKSERKKRKNSNLYMKRRKTLNLIIQSLSCFLGYLLLLLCEKCFHLWGIFFPFSYLYFAIIFFPSLECSSPSSFSHSFLHLLFNFFFFFLLLICHDVSCIFFSFSLFHHLQCLLIYYEDPEGVQRVVLLDFIIISCFSNFYI